MILFSLRWRSQRPGYMSSLVVVLVSGKSADNILIKAGGVQRDDSALRGVNSQCFCLGHRSSISISIKIRNVQQHVYCHVSCVICQQRRQRRPSHLGVQAVKQQRRPSALRPCNKSAQLRTFVLNCLANP